MANCRDAIVKSLCQARLGKDVRTKFLLVKNKAPTV
jgi:hypothetical protein